MKVKNVLGWIYGVVVMVLLVIIINNLVFSDNHLLFTLVGMILLSAVLNIIMFAFRYQRFTLKEARKWQIPWVYNKMEGLERFCYYHAIILIVAAVVLICIRGLKIL